jgi:hypothetical protein
MKDILDKIKAWLKRNTKDLVRLAILFAAFGLVAALVETVGDWVFACIVWAAVEAVIGLIKKNA